MLHVPATHEGLMNVIGVDFNQNWNVPTSFTSYSSYQILLKSIKQAEKRREN